MECSKRKFSEMRNLRTSIKRGLLANCPKCGIGRLFKSYLKINPRCEVCDEVLSHHRADDLPAYVVLFIVGHIIVGLLMAVESHSNWPIGLHILFWPTLTVFFSLLILQPVKGAIVGLQWALRMHGFGQSPTNLSTVDRPIKDNIHS
ncbi:MAG: DUF983 domain-containing protein [Hyphomicrobiales bacterium]